VQTLVGAVTHEELMVDWSTVTESSDAAMFWSSVPFAL